MNQYIIMHIPVQWSHSIVLITDFFLLLFGIKITGRILFEVAMAEAEITVREDDELLREIIDPSGIVATLMNTNCGTNLSGCIEGRRTSMSDVGRWTLVMSCGHVLCEQCKEQCARTDQERVFDLPLFQCPICAEFGSANKLPGPASVNLVSCQTSYCSGEEFTPSSSRCDECSHNICTGCVETHAERFPYHNLTSHDSKILVTKRRAFTGCATHKEPVTSRCDCGEMLCNKCPYNYLSLIPGTTRVQNHAKTKMEEVDLELEDSLEDTISTISRIRAMRSLAAQKKKEVEEVTDNMANEVALHFNQIILQAVQRCFDVLKGVKQLGAAHHSAIDNHLKILDKTERQLSVGVEIDERARSRDAVKAESVSQYVRNVAYGLLKPAMEQFEDSKEFSAQLTAAPFDIAIKPTTADIVESIGKWGEIAYTNGDDVSKPLIQAQIPASKARNPASMVNGEDLGDEFYTGRSIMATKIPLRLHSALEHFTDLYERCFASPSILMDSEVPEGYKREMPFQVGLREAPEGRISEEETEARHAYERYLITRPGMRICQPKIFGGFRRIYNLVDRPSLTQKDVQMVYSRSPCLSPIWMAEGAKAPDVAQPVRQLQQPTAVAATAASNADSSRSTSIVHEERPTAEAAADSDTDDVVVLSLSPTHAAVQPLQQATPAGGQKVVRKSKFVFFKKVAPAPIDAPPVLQPEETTPRQSYGTPAPSRLLGPSILRRAAPSQQQQSTYFRPVNAAERSAIAAASPKPSHARLSESHFQPQPKPLLRVVPPTNNGRPRYFKGPDDAVRVVRNGSFTTRPFPRLVPGVLSSARMEAGRDSDRLIQREDSADGPSVRVNTMRAPETLYSIRDISKSKLLLPSEKVRARVLQDTPEEKEKRKELHWKGFGESEINSILDRDRRDKLNAHTTTSTQSLMSGMRIVVPTNRNGPSTLAHVLDPSRFSMGGAGSPNSGQPAFKKRMLPIERAFTNMFGADGSNIPDFACRRRGRPSKDDPTAPSNIIEQFKRHQTQWPPKFDEMDEAEIEELQDLIDQLDAATREEEEGERSYSQWDNGYGVRPEAEDPKSSPWQSFTMQERDQIKAAAREKIQVAKTAGKGCFVCALVRHHEGKPRNWQCCECKKRGRALTPLGDNEIIPADPTIPEAPLAKKSKRSDPQAELERDEEDDVEVQEAEDDQPPVDLSALFAHIQEKKVETRGRPRKNKASEEPAAALAPALPKHQRRTPREPRKRREPVGGAETEQTAAAVAVVQEEVVMGTTRRGRQIKMPSKLKGHEVTTAGTTTARRSPSEASDAPSESVSSHSHSTAALPTSSATSTPKVTKKVEEREIKEESPDPEPRSAMDAPLRRGGRRRY
ncbi:hypothetical protein PRIPAC_78662 [Pristionchus pacificus]|uniref:Uncharacterized protein n=1 Tax=Pristionchus pacificus TaxID=54126 RepID=A0A2A6CNV3_PRIPA|nr:hypothetical protein PRIPAC_78662 [Pristionchus pacificus]|eukprot:PDM79778.1 hypothetical protein PRIPAC_32357 [Pristionchus pacificus]